MTGPRSAPRPLRSAHRIALAAVFLIAASPLMAQQPVGTRPLPPVGGPAAGVAPVGPPPAQSISPTAHEALTAPQDTAPIGQTTALPGQGTATPGRELAHDLSPWSMFLNADILVKAVMVGLALASVITWTILLAKSVELGLSRTALARSLARVAGGGTLAEAEAALAGGRRSVVARLIAAVSDEVRISPGATPDGIKERAASRCSEIVKAEGRTARRGMGALATIGAISPFVGLFGTVWGIMNSFIGISKAQTTNLAVVAPGIAEALLATAIGLVAAIPAVIIYNHFARATRGYGDLVQRASGAVMRLLSRDLDRPGAARAFVLPRAAE